MKYPKYYWDIYPSIEQEIEMLFIEKEHYRLSAENSAFLGIKIATSYFRKREVELQKKIENLQYKLSILSL